jgi:acetylornithine deacetylase
MDTKANVSKMIDQFWKEEVEFLQHLGRFPSTLGNETAIQQFLANYFKDELELEVDAFIPDMKRLSKLPGFSPPEWSYEGRPVVVAKAAADGPKLGKSLILQGHIDVVPLGPTELWDYDPWGSTIVGNRMYGRGIQDMKSGVTAMIFAYKALKKAGVKLGADVIFQSVMEEECTGNGALAALDRGYVADGALIPEPFGLHAVTSQVGVIWLRIIVTGAGAHTERADRAVNAIEKAYKMIDALNEYRWEINARPKHPDFKDKSHPLNVNIGTIRSGDWPSSVPSVCTIEARVGFYPGTDPTDVKAEVKEWIDRAADHDEWLRNTRPEVTFYGFHADGFSVDGKDELFQTLERAHNETQPSKMEHIAITATTDLRFFNLFYGIPATCYGPVGSGMHGVNEWVDLDSVKAVTKTYAAFMMEWCGVRE